MSESMSNGRVLLDEPAPHVARLRINRPDKRNAIDHAVREELLHAFDALDEWQVEGRARAVVFGGVGGIFSAGGDLPTMLGLSPAQAHERMQHVHRVCRRIAALPLPVVSAVEGVAAGAAVGLALLGDRIVVGDGTRLLFPFLKLGLTPDWGQLHTLPRRVGIAEARRIFSAGATVDGAQALRIGLADERVADADVMPAAVRVAQELARLPLQAWARTKQRLNAPSASLDEEFEREAADQAVCMTSADFAEGYAAFAGKRAPDFIARPGAQQ